jgi:HupE / UreJ protein
MRKILAIWIVLTGGALAVGAHPNLQDAMWVLFEPADVRLAVNVSLQEISVAQGLPAGADSDALNRVAAQHVDYLLNHLTLSAGTNVLAGRFVRLAAPAVVEAPEQTFCQFEFVFPIKGTLPGEIGISQNMLQEWPYAAGAAWDVSYVVRIKRSGETNVTTRLLRNQQTTTLSTGWNNSSAPAANGWRTFREYLWHGIRHILTGYDHLLFVSALVIATMSFWEMVKVIAAFTLAHTLTLALCVFGIFRLPAFIVEPVIAMSIVFVALENVFWPHRAHSRIRLAVAFGFGLIHGLGFAGGLLDAMAGLPAVGIWIALGAFSLGVEIGHQVVMLPFYGLLSVGRRKLADGFHFPVFRYGSAIISCCGLYYLVVAIHEQFFLR